jgi:hypothetical protein
MATSSVDKVGQLENNRPLHPGLEEKKLHGRTHLSKRHVLDYETKLEPLLSRRAFARRLARNFAVASLLIGVSLLAGMIGYHFLEGMEWIDAFVNASMILSGMGPADPLKTWGGKLFAGIYALYCGLTLVFATGIILAPIVHRLLHKFHMPDDSK